MRRGGQYLFELYADATAICKLNLWQIISGKRVFAMVQIVITMRWQLRSGFQKWTNDSFSFHTG